MQVVVTLSYGGIRVQYTDARDYHDLDEAISLWTEGPMGCDCARSLILRSMGILDVELDCNEGPPRVQVMAVYPLYVM